MHALPESIAMSHVLSSLVDAAERWLMSRYGGTERGYPQHPAAMNAAQRELDYDAYVRENVAAGYAQPTR
jgi:hypothetical protein